MIYLSFYHLKTMRSLIKTVFTLILLQCVRGAPDCDEKGLLHDFTECVNGYHKGKV